MTELFTTRNAAYAHSWKYIYAGHNAHVVRRGTRQWALVVTFAA